jgi:hypothetical protein
MTHSSGAPNFLPILGIFVPSPEGEPTGSSPDVGAQGERCIPSREARAWQVRDTHALPSPQEEMGLGLSSLDVGSNGGLPVQATEIDEVSLPAGEDAESSRLHQGPKI